MQRICVFCGSKPGNDPAFQNQAAELGRCLVANGLELVFGGGRVGLMGVVADAVLAAGGHVIGVIPEMLATVELLHSGVPEMHLVDSMHTRKATMAELADAFIALPGGYGTLEELFEIITWAQLGIHQNPIGLLNVNGFYDPLVEMIDHMIAADFIKPHNRDLFFVENEPAKLLEHLSHHKMPTQPKRLTTDET
ncbi:MAG: TIGR00730 family Rossman fold protein [Planctomycetaceae bacterium]|nr:TIGR00730 family Rossman fold protein [Planctomycetaceae bacterium]